MMSEEQLDGRSALGFSELVQSAFEMVALEHGLRLVEALETLVRYESERIFLNIYHGRRSYEIGVEVGLLSDGGDERYRLPDVLAAILGPDHAHRTYLQASSPEALATCVRESAALVEQYYAPLLEGIPEVWDKVAASTAEASRQYTKQVVQQPVREAADSAWKRKDYRKVIDLYTSIIEDLSATERKRLGYAKKHV